MSFLKRIFGGRQSGGRNRDSGDEGFFLYVRCDNCGEPVRLRVLKQYDLNRTEDGLVWHKTIVDNRCFRPMSTVVHFDHRYNVTRSEIDGGHYISREEFESIQVNSATDLDDTMD